MYRTCLKRIFDLLVASLGLVAISPVLLIVGIAIRLTIGSPVFFLQQRPGRNGKPFIMVKFRTMTNATDMEGHLLPFAERITRFGRFLRSTSLDELPELWNVLKGEMSMVGPRPLLMDYLPLYTSEQLRRHAVLPGITGWAQVHGRNALSWEEKFTMDTWYVDNCTLWVDVKVLFMTGWSVLHREGITPCKQEKMPRFTGALPDKGANPDRPS